MKRFPLATVHPNVRLGADPQIGPYVLLGEPKRGAAPGENALVIGDRPVIRSHSVIYAGNSIGDGFQTGHHVLIREDNRIGHDVSIGTSSVVEFSVTIGNGVRLHSQTFIPEFSVLEDECWVGPNAVITNAAYPKSKRTKEFLMGVHLGRRAKIGANATLLPGITIGQGALVGAGAVVSKDLPEFVVAVGNPARIIGTIFDLRFPDESPVYSREDYE